MWFFVITIFILMLILVANVLVIREDIKKLIYSQNCVVNHLFNEVKKEITNG